MAKCSGHVWVLVRTVSKHGRTYYFYECAICSAPKMEVK